MNETLADTVGSSTITEALCLAREIGHHEGRAGRRFSPEAAALRDRLKALIASTPEDAQETLEHITGRTTSSIFSEYVDHGALCE